MAAEIELKKINDYVKSLIAITNITGAYVYGIDSNGASIKIAIASILSSADVSDQIQRLQELCDNNAEQISALNTFLQTKAATSYVDEQLNGKADEIHNHTIEDIEGLEQRLGNIENLNISEKIADYSRKFNNYDEAISTMNESLIELQENIENNTELTDLEQRVTANETNISLLELNKSDVGHTHNLNDIENLNGVISDLRLLITNNSDKITTINNDIEGLKEQVRDGVGGSGGIGTDTNALHQVDDLEVYRGTVGEIVQFIGNTTTKYTNGYIYYLSEKEFLVNKDEKYIIVDHDFPSTKQGVYVYQGTTSEDIDCKIVEYTTATDGDDNTYFSSPTEVLELNSVVWNEKGELFQIKNISSFGLITLDNDTQLLKKSEIGEFAKAEIYTNTEGASIYRIPTMAGYFGILRGTNIYCEGIGSHFSDSYSVKTATETSTAAVLPAWVRIDVQPNHEENVTWQTLSPDPSDPQSLNPEPYDEEWDEVW